ncbi:MAG TPA: cell wall-binding repeat-containing protein [Egibacteraceae bacterium]|nr:cell wall-binding repeat-containing protein [Actinomycetota bacterium]HWB71491.1 cell wall-binding repeat-containing protein [Egibacteraceae bacterium]
MRTGMALAVLAVLVAFLPTPASAAVGEIVRTEGDGLVPTERFNGLHRYDTAQLIAEETFATSDTVLLARSNIFADALSGNYLAGQLGVPVLLVSTFQLQQDTLDALENLGASNVILLGEEDAISVRSEQALSAMGLNVSRIGGIDRYETAALIASRTGNAYGELDGRRTAVMAYGDDFADALVAGSLVYAEELPLLLTYSHRVPDVAKSALRNLGIEQVVIAGGPGVVSQNVESELVGMGINVIRVSGPTRTATSVALSHFAVDRFGWTFEHLNVARGNDFADALTIGPHAGEERSVLLLTATPTNMDVATVAPFLESASCQTRLIHVAGGQVAVSNEVEQQVRDAATDATRLCPDAVADTAGVNLILDDQELVIGLTEAAVQTDPTAGHCAINTLACAQAASLAPPLGQLVTATASDQTTADSTHESIPIPAPLSEVVSGEILAAFAQAVTNPHPQAIGESGLADLEVKLPAGILPEDLAAALGDLGGTLDGLLDGGLTEPLPDLGGVTDTVGGTTDTVLGGDAVFTAATDPTAAADTTGLVARLSDAVDQVLADPANTPLATINLTPGRSLSEEVDFDTTATATSVGATIVVLPTAASLPEAPEGLIVLQVAAAQAEAAYDAATELGSAEAAPVSVRLNALDLNTGDLLNLNLLEGVGVDQQCTGVTPLTVCVGLGSSDVIEDGSTASATAAGLTLRLFEGPLPQIGLDIAAAHAAVEAHQVVF